MEEKDTHEEKEDTHDAYMRHWLVKGYIVTTEVHNTAIAYAYDL